MKATLTFNLPEEKEEFETTLLAGKMASFIREFENYLRRLDKYDLRETYNIVEIRDDFYEKLREHDL